MGSPIFSVGFAAFVVFVPGREDCPTFRDQDRIGISLSGLSAANSLAA
jgi:hypothetical protein